MEIPSVFVSGWEKMILFFFFVGLIIILLCFKGFRKFLYYAFALVISLGTAFVVITAFGALVVFGLVFLLGRFN